MQRYINDGSVKKLNLKGKGMKKSKGRCCKGKMGGWWNPFNKDSWKSLGNKDTWKPLGDKIVSAVKQPFENVKNLAGATKDAFNSMKDSTNWKNAILHPGDWSRNQLDPWMKNNKVISSALGTFGTAAGPVAGSIMENGSRAVGYGIKKKKRTVKRKQVKQRGGILF